MYADDMQVYGHCQPDQILNAISDWMFSSRLQLDASKTEVMRCSSGRLAPELSSKSVVICSNLIQPVQSVCNLGIWLNSDCSTTTHINKTIRSCYTSLRKIRSIAAPFSFNVRKHLYIFYPIKDLLRQFNSGLPAHNLEQLQRVIYVGDKIKSNNRKHDHHKIFFMISNGYAFAKELTTKSLHSFSSLSLVMYRHTCLSLALHIFLLGTGSDQQPGSPSSNHQPDVRHWMRHRSIDAVGPQICNRPPFDYQH